MSDTKATEPTEEELLQAFSSKKKRRPKVEDDTNTAHADEKLGEEPTEEDLEAVFSQKKKRRGGKKGKRDREKERKEGDLLDEQKLDEQYQALLDRIYDKLQAHNPELLKRSQKHLQPPQVLRVGSKRSGWTNFKEICETLSREEEHVLKFVLAELGTTGSIDGSNRLVLKGKFTGKQMETLLRRYIGEYVSCRSCRSLETTLTKDNISRLYFMTCTNCGASRSVAPVKAGYKAVGRGERKRARQAAGR